MAKNKLTSMWKKGVGGWFGESLRHSLARKKVRTKIDYGFIDQYGGQGVFDPFYDNPKDSDGDGIPDVYDLHPFNPEKGRYDWAKKDLKIRYKKEFDYIMSTHATPDEKAELVEKLIKYYKNNGLKFDYAKPEIKGQQLRIRVMSPKKCIGKYGTQDVGKKGRLQRVACQTDKGWSLQSWRLNLSHYKNNQDAMSDLLSIKSLSPKQKGQAIREAHKYFEVK